jgi:predicted nucleic acid-binding protein
VNSWICLDANVALKLVLHEPDSEQARDLWQSLLLANRQPVAPPLFPIEITAVMRKHVHHGIITEDYGLTALRYLLNLKVRLEAFPGIHERAWHLATQLNRPTAYDAYYLALAEKLDCEFWTSDQRLYNAVSSQLLWVRWLGNFTV